MTIAEERIPSLELLEQELKKEKHKTFFGRTVRSTVFTLVIVAAIAVIIAMLLLPVIQINGTSMEPTLQEGNVVVAVNSKKYKTGDVIAFYYNNNILVKRVIASSGEWVDLDEEGNVYVNGVKLDEPYITEKSLGETNIKLPYQVPDGRCFVMGDHRETSIDSRNTAVGCISNDKVIGRLLFRFWPFNDFGTVN